MKKDSFTFSDKLKKSKTLPLSKRIPSRIGGEVKAKRTLFERAQRDLPFIIVAALALLLLPFLSRESVDDIPSVVWPGNGEEEIDITQRPISETNSDSTFAGFNDPLKWISTASGRDSSMRNAIDTPSEYDTDASESSSGSSSGYSYDSKSQEDYYSSSKTPATGKYGKTVRRSVRNSINRVPTQIGSLRASSLPGARAGQGVSHTLATGAKAKGPTSQSNLSGVRPVALQPLSAKGGRDLTGGDALYAEAARSIGAFNKPGAKQALLEAQLKDVDGQPLGETKGGPGEDSARPGVGGNLANNWHHSPLKPWWWDMMNDRAQKRWMLWHYNWEEMLSKNLINWTSGLMSCLVVGDAGGKVDKFLGADGSDPDGKCVDAAGNEVYIRRRQYIKELKVQGGKESSGAAVSALPWEEACVKYGHGRVQFKPGSDHKSFWDVRFECLGLDLGAIKEKTQLQRKTICNGLYSDPMYITIEAKRNGKVKVNKVKATGYYIVDKKGCVVDIQQARYGKNTLPEYSDEKIKQLDKVVVFRIGTTNLTNDDIYLSSGQREDLDSANKEAPEKKKAARAKARKDLKANPTDEQKNKEKELKEKLAKATDEKEKAQIKKELENLEYDIKEKKEKIKATREQEISDAEVENIIELAQYNITNRKYKGCYTEEQLHETLKPIGKWRTQYNAKRYLNELATCPVPGNRFTGTKVSPARINPEESTASFDGLTCDDRVVYIDQSNTTHAISATIKNPGPRTVAVVLEYVQGGATVSTDYMEGKVPERTGYLVKEVIDFSKENSWRTRSVTKKDENGKSYEEASYAADFVVGLSSTIKDDTGAMEDSHGTNNLPGARAGKGYVIWITTDDMDAELIRRNAFVTDKSDINALLKLSREKGYKSAMCEYRWGCESSSCSAANLDNYFCYDDDGNSQNGPFYNAIRVKNFMLKRSPTTVDKSMLTSNPVRCDPLCVFLDNTYGVLPSKEEPYDPLPGVKLTLEDLAGAYVDDDCPHCNEDVKPEPKRGTGKICYELIGGKQVPYPCIKIENSKVPNKNPLYIKSDIIPVQPEDEMEEITPICYKKAIALGNIYVREPDGTGKVQVKPDDKIVEMLLTKTPEEQEKLCPYCDGQDKKPEPDPIVRLDKDTIIDFSTPCEVKLQGDYFRNASYIFKQEQVDKMAAHLDRIYTHLQKCGDITIEGHASKTMTVGKEDGFTPEQAKERNNIRLSFDRGISAAEIVRPVWNSKGKTVSVDLSHNNPSNNYTGESSNTEEQSLPKHRNSISPDVVPGADVTFIITGVGSEYATAPARPKANGTAAEKAAWRKAEMGDRKVILRGHPQD